MPVKEHQDPTHSNRRAIAPYNFVSLPNQALPAPELPPHNTDDYHSGFIECTLETFSPMYIRGMQKTNLFRRLAAKKPADITVLDKLERAPFYQVGGGAQIPASSLRGLFRTLVEILSWSKPLAVSSDPLVYRSVDTTSHGIKYRDRLMEEVSERTFRPRFKAGYMRRRGGDWYIQPAREYNGISYGRIAHELLHPVFDDLDEVNRNWKHVHKIYVKVGAPAYHPVREFLSVWSAKVEDASAGVQTGCVEALVSASGRMESKKSEAVIFPPDPAKATVKDWIAISDQLAYQYRENLSQQLRQFLGPKGVIQEGYPVFYLVEGGTLVAFGHCQMLRLPYHHTPQELVPDEVRATTQPDLAEAMFGYTGKQYAEGTSRKGRLSFSDGNCLPDQSDIFLPVIRPQILSTPKPTSFQLYLTQDNPDQKDQLQDYDSDANIRGTKFYWHKGERSASQLETSDPDADRHESQYTRIQPVRAGVRFKFQIHFHNLTDLELGLLGWTLTIAQHKNSRMKLGMGKPLGMGAVLVTSAIPHLFDRECRYENLFLDHPNKVQWQSGEYPADTAQHELRAGKQVYKDWLLAQSAANPLGCAAFHELPRVQELLTLLAWPGPSPVEQYTRYQKIQTREYVDRPVLPTPAGVMRNLSNAPAPAPARPAPQKPQETKPQPPQQPEKIRQVAADIFSQLQQLTERPLPTTGETVTAVVFDPGKQESFTSIVGQPENVIGRIRTVTGRSLLYHENQELLCRVISGGQQVGSDTIFDLEPIE